MLRIILFCLALLPAGLNAAGGNFTIDASVDKDKVELGEALRFTLRMHVQGSLDFPPQMEQPKFEGFNAQGPQQGSNVQWINGQVSMDYSWTWELVPMKAGTLILGPYVAKAKDAKSGEIIQQTKAVAVQVRRPKKLAFQLPAPRDQPPPPPPEPGADELRDIKPDRGLGWPFWTALISGLLGLSGFAAWWLLWRKPKAKEDIPKDPLALCLSQLEKARQEVDANGDSKAFARAVDGALRAYLRVRLGLPTGSTLKECLRALGDRAPWLEMEKREALQRRLLMLLYADAAPDPEDGEELYGDARALAQGLEQCVRLEPLLLELEHKLKQSVALFKEGRRKQGWMSLRANFLAHIRKTMGTDDPRQARAKMQKRLASLETPELLQVAALVYEADPPADMPVERINEQMITLARALLNVSRAEKDEATKEDDHGK